MTVHLDTLACRNLDKSIAVEWLRTNGLGGYASGTVAGVNTRKYHGYLVVSAHPPVERYVVLSRVEDRAIVNGAAYDLATDEFPDVIHPQGYSNLISFELKAGPVWRYQLGDAVIEKSVTLIHGEDTVIVRYALVGRATGNEPVKLIVHPMLAGRDFHSTIQSQWRPTWIARPIANSPDGLALSAPECPVPLNLSHNADRFNPNASWWYNFVFRQERMRGYPDREDLWTPGSLEFTITPDRPVGFICSTRNIPWAMHTALLHQEETRCSKTAHTFHDARPKDPILSELATASDQFIVHRGVASTASSTPWSVIAGYPWFEDWGRDAFISLPGLTLTTGRFMEARSILVTFADHMQNGLLPNRFPDKAVKPDYNTVDASLWFIQAAYSYWRYSGDLKLLRDYLYRPLCEIIEKYRDGTDFGIRMDSDGLIRAGQPGVQLTWMDAKVGDWVVTPRYGKPVEVNALWYNALRIMALLANEANDPTRAREFESLAGRVEASFAETFWNAEADCLFDVIDDDGNKDAAIRPNQIFAASLPFSALHNDQCVSVLNRVHDDLMTPMGLRTLAPGSPGYRGHYVGDALSRDMAYHQGTAWPWLIGAFITATVRIADDKDAARRACQQLLQPLLQYLKANGSICEIADGDAPFAPRGTIAQAWSIGEVLRAYYEDILNAAPPYPHQKAVAAR
jgi:predicted glycogen debranching enzyme